jgi:DNA-binding MarR family transcriptional regulator
MPEDLADTLTNALFDLAAAIDLVGQAAAARLGINQTDLICLRLLMRNGPMSAGEVAAAVGLTTAAISAMATRMEAGGYAHREIDTKDRRRILLHAVQPAAREAIAHFDGLYASIARLCGEYRDRDLRLLLDLVGRFTALVSEQRTVLRSTK